MSLPTVFSVLGCDTRRSILLLLSERDMTAGEIAKQFDMAWPSVSHHLMILKTCGIVTARKEGQKIIYSFNVNMMEEVTNWVRCVCTNLRKRANASGAVQDADDITTIEEGV